MSTCPNTSCCIDVYAYPGKSVATSTSADLLGTALDHWSPPESLAISSSQSLSQPAAHPRCIKRGERPKYLLGFCLGQKLDRFSFRSWLPASSVLVCPPFLALEPVMLWWRSPKPQGSRRPTQLSQQEFSLGQKVLHYCSSFLFLS